jgi:formyl-CoA transferase
MGAAAQQSNGTPLEGVKVIELGSLIAGPYAAGILAQFGAEVIKVEPPIKGDPLRTWRKLHHGTSLWWYTQSRNKKSITLDLRAAEGQHLIRQLVKEGQVVIENFRPGTLEKWGLGWDDLSAINPELIMVRVSGYGQFGPYHQRPGFAAIAECMGGLRYVSGYPDRPPVRSGISLGDTLASLYGVIGALLALYHLKANKGKGQYIDVALYEAVFAVMESLIPEYSAQGFVRGPSGASLPGISPSGTYRCRGGEYVTIAGNGDSIFKRLMKAIGREDLSNDPRLERNDGRVEHNDLLEEAIGTWTAERELETVLAILQAAEVPADRIYTAADIARDPHYRARGMLERHHLPDGTPIELPGIVPLMSGTPGRTRSLGPALGEHTDEVLRSLGYASQAIAGLRNRGVI